MRARGKAREGCRSLDELEDLQGLHAKLLRMTSSLGAQGAAKSSAEGKVMQ